LPRPPIDPFQPLAFGGIHVQQVIGTEAREPFGEVPFQRRPVRRPVRQAADQLGDVVFMRVAFPLTEQLLRERAGGTVQPLPSFVRERQTFRDQGAEIGIAEQRCRELVALHPPELDLGLIVSLPDNQYLGCLRCPTIIQREFVIERPGILDDGRTFDRCAVIAFGHRQQGVETAP